MFYFIFTHNFYRCRPWNESICQKVAQRCWIMFDLGLQCTICTIPNDDFCAITEITNIPFTLWSLNSDQVKYLLIWETIWLKKVIQLIMNVWFSFSPDPNSITNSSDGFTNFVTKVLLFTVRYTKRQITALTFFCHYKNNNENHREWQNSLILKVKKWIQRSDSIQIWSRRT